MAKPNYGFQKRQKELLKQKKKAEKMRKKQESPSETGEAGDQLQLAEMIEDVKARLRTMDETSELHGLGTGLLENLPHHPEEVSLELARAFLERTDTEN